MWLGAPVTAQVSGAQAAPWGLEWEGRISGNHLGTELHA